MLTAILLALISMAHAHELGATRVSAAFRDGKTFEIEIATDASALVAKIQRSTTEITDVAELRAVLPSLDAQFRRRMRIAFDEAEARPDIAYTITPALNKDSAVLATIRLTGNVPSNAQQFSLKYGWTFTPYALTLKNRNGDAVTEWVEGGLASKPFPLSRLNADSRPMIAGRYLMLGFTHIFPHGLDHMLFVLGIYLLSRKTRIVLWQVSAFTIAHSITLGLSLYGIIAVPPKVVEPLIAVSIAYVAIENIFLSELKSWRVALVFAFGLLHGMGFAGALHEVGLPRAEFLTALITFNIGVEAGQLAVIAGAFVLVGWHASTQWWYRARVVIPASAMIACVALYWTVERLVG